MAPLKYQHLTKRIFPSLFLVAFLALPITTLAAFTFTPALEPQYNETNSINFTAVLGAIINVLWNVFVAGVVVFSIITAFLFLTTYGDPAKIKRARFAVLFSVVGIVVVIIGYRILPTIINLF